MNPIVPPIAKILAILTLGTDIGILIYVTAGIVAIKSPPLRETREKLLALVAPYARILAFVVALVATSGSLFFSEIARYTPCLLCWWQRIFMYPQVLLIGLGIIKNDKDIADYSIAMSIIGGAIALYHYYIQLGGKTFLTCETIGYSVSCTERFSLEFGYITIPMMALSAFAAIVLLMLLSKRYANV